MSAKYLYFVFESQTVPQNMFRTFVSREQTSQLSVPRNGSTKFPFARRSPYCENNSYSPYQEFPQPLIKLPFHYCVHKSLPLVPVLSQLNPVRTITPYFFKVLLNSIFPPTSRFPSGLFYSGFMDQILCLCVILPTWTTWYFPKLLTNHDKQ
jgi:hypothetical protein